MHSNTDITGSTVDLRPFDLEIPGLDMPSSWEAEVTPGDQAGSSGELEVDVPMMGEDTPQSNLLDDAQSQEYMSRRERHLSLLASGWEQAGLC